MDNWKLVLMGGPREVDPSHERANQRPFIANQPDQTIYVGGPGGYHGTIYDNMPNGWGHHWRGTIHADGQYEHLGASEEDMGPEVNHVLQEHGLTPIGGWENKFSKVAKETPGQVARRWGELLDQYPDNSKVLHTTPEGYTIRHLPTFGDISRTGLHMRNCWQGLSSYSDQSREVDPWHIHQRYSLNDEKGHPQVAFFVKHPQHGADSFDVSEPLGPRNKAPKPHYEQALKSWAAEKGYNYQEADYENPFLERNYGAVDDPTWDDDELTEEQEYELRDIRDPYKEFDHAEPIRKLQYEPSKPHREQDDMSTEDFAYEEADAPLIFDGKRFYQGMPNSYHWDMIAAEPELQTHVNMDDYMVTQPMKAVKPEARAGLAYGRFNPTTEAVTWYHRGRFHPDKFTELSNHVFGDPYDESEDMGFSSPEEQWQNLFHSKVEGHSLVWGPGWPGKAFYRPDTGELTTWGVNSTHHAVAWPHHTHMWGMRYPGEDMRAKASLLNIHPDGRVYEAHPDQGDWETTARAIQQIDPQLKPFEPEWEDMFSE